MSDDCHPWTSAALTAVAGARRPVILTGAGMSAESGVPTFRDALTGLWARFRPEELATPEAFAASPGRVWEWYEARRAGVRAARPHAGHQALVALEALWGRLPIITQNVDGFHRDAGSGEVIELHGNIMRTVCSVTRRVIDHDWLSDHPKSPPPSPHHPEGLARPDVVWFGEPLPEAALERALQLAGAADLLLCIGTSALVQPAASLPLLAKERGALLLEVNPDDTALSPAADWCIRSKAGPALEKLANVLPSWPHT